MKPFILFFIFLFISGINSLRNETSEIIEISVDSETDIEYEISPYVIYKFIIENDKYIYLFPENFKSIFHIYNKGNNLEKPIGKLFFEKGDIILANYLLELKELAKIKISSVPLYNELNSFETITQNQYFSIKSEVESIAYFDSFDRNSKIFLSKNEEEKISENDEKIDGQFKIIEPNKLYFIKNEIFDVSVFKKYLYSLNINQEIYVKNDEKSFFYLQAAHTYTLNFEGNKMKKMIKLSEKTSNSKIKISKNGVEVITLNNEQPYYELENKYSGKLTLEILENDAFIEFLSGGDAKILTDLNSDRYLVQENTVVIKIPKTQKSFNLEFQSDNIIKYSLSFGISNKDNYYYTSNSNFIVDSQKNEIILQYLSLFKNINLRDNEFLSLAINFERVEQDKLYIKYNQFSQIDEVLDENLSSDDCQNVIKHFSDILEIYVYTDIAKNPPEIKGYPYYHHKKIDLIEELNAVSTENRKFYEFYQEIKKILTATRDLHFNSYCTDVNDKSFLYQAFLPFNFIIGDYKGEKRIFIVKNQQFDKFDTKTRDIIESHLNIPLKKINSIDPFDYIQNWSQFSATKNPHAQFTNIINTISSFYLMNFPVYYWNLTSNDYEFEDNTILRLSYKLDLPLLLGNNYNINNTEFKEYFLKKISEKKYQLKLPTIDEVYESYLIYKGINKKVKSLKESTIKWDIVHEEEENKFFLKCRVDDINGVNVLVQNAFDLNEEARIIIINCAKLFHKNKYPIIIIETKNEGGDPYLSLLMIQLFQMREVERTYSAYRLSDVSKDFYKNDHDNYIKPKSCEEIKSIEDLNEETDYYTDNGLNIEHKRTEVFISLISNEEREALNHFREEYKNSENLKKPTDIIIFTDSLSYSATSTLIKGFQNIGGAITVGYFGNPKIKGIDLFDASQSDSGVINLPPEDVGGMYFDVGVTNEEIFNDLYQKGNPIPREYQLNPVDDRVEIYSEYSDEIYDKFIEEGKKIHHKFNDEGYCNSNNKNLIFHDNNNCYEISGKEHAHGGYICGDDNKWNKNECVPYYCDIGYSYDLSLEQCVEDCKSKYESFYLHENTFSKQYNIKNSETYLFQTKNLEYSYVFQLTENDKILDNNGKDFLPKISFVNGNNAQIIINPERSNNEIQLKINSFKSDITFLQIKKEKIELEDFLNIYKKLMIVIELSEEHIVSLSKYNDKIKYTKYKNDMNYLEVLNGDNNIYKKYLGDLLHLEKDETYIFYFDFNEKDRIFLDFNIEPVNKDEKIDLDSYSEKNYIYLKKNKHYKLGLQYLSTNAMLKLSKRTLNSLINIKDELNSQINSTNYYYKINQNENNNELELEIAEEDAFIEILYKENNIDEVDTLDFERKNFILTKKYNLLEIPKKYASNIINFEIKTTESSNYTISQGYSLFLYNHFPIIEKEDLIQLDNYNFTVFAPYEDKEKFMEEENYSILIIILKGKLDLSVKIKEKANNNSKNLPGWAIALIVLACIIVFAILVFLIIHYVGKCKN